MGQLGRSILIPAELAHSRGYRFPIDKATKDQIQALDKLIKKYLQKQFVMMFPRVGARTIAAALNCGDSTAFALIKDATASGDPWEDLVEVVLLGMHNKVFAGPLGTPKNDTTKWLFEKMHHFGSNRIAKQATHEAAALGQLLAAFRVDFYEWRKGG
ncbi:hypothetical protein V5E97_09940 [Singulisphaera sp. Ch08]|uniref:Uncharacterized protein n=1 Tax=Singulisphaera sp. Ch08 TaxID=3120278 RepID=A0AAU7CMT6_9BACT